MTLTPLSSLATTAAPALANHLWQSTAFAAAIWLLTLLLRRNHARIRYTLWLAASIKFLLPFSLLITLGTLLPKPQQIAPPTTIYSAIDTASQPFTQLDTPIAPTPATPTLQDRLTALLPAALAILWLCGALTVLLIWYTRWRQVHSTLKRSTPITAGRELEILRRLQTQSSKAQSRTTKPITLLQSPDLMEPGIFGILRPTLLWPHRLSDQLEDQHIEAILAHETVHVQRRDNLTAALHMLVVEAAFWFHPIVWWMERRMIEERERACDEAVVQQGGNPETYAESLLKACRFCLESPLPCVAGITGADLSRRVRSIMTLQLEEMSLSKKLVLTTLIFATLAGPVAFGIVHMIPTYGQILHASGPLPSFEVVSIRLWKRTPLPPSLPSGEKIIHETVMKVSPNSSPGQLSDHVHFTMPIEVLIASAYNLPPSSKRILGGPDWIRQDYDQYDIQAKIEASQFAAMQKMPPAQQREQVALMEQSLLADRFKLKVHFETREMPGYALVLAKGGSKLTSAKDVESNQILTVDGEHGTVMTAKAVTLDQLVRSPLLLGGALVVDQTGLKGPYDFTMTFQRDQLATPDSTQSDPGAPSLFTAIQQQLGLKLVPTKAPTEVLIIDHIEQPTGDAGGEAPATQAETPAPNAAPQPPVAAKSPSFEVVSVRQSKPGSKVRVGTTPDGYSETDLPLKAIISNAYGIRQELISGAPSWTDSTAYDINAKVDEPTAAAMQKLSNEKQGAQTRLMLQAVLADRFHLKVTRVTKESPVYHLVIAKSGFKLKQADPKNTYATGIKGPDGVGTGLILTGSGQVVGQAIPISMLATNLMYQVDRSVVDKTGLTGKYDFSLKWAPDQGSNGAPAPDDSRPSLFTALQEQLGLKLEPAKGPVESLIIDHVERPSEN